MFKLSSDRRRKIHCRRTRAKLGSNPVHFFSNAAEFLARRVNEASRTSGDLNHPQVGGG